MRRNAGKLPSFINREMTSLARGPKTATERVGQERARERALSGRWEWQQRPRGERRCPLYA